MFVFLFTCRPSEIWIQKRLFMIHWGFTFSLSLCGLWFVWICIEYILTIFLRISAHSSIKLGKYLPKRVLAIFCLPAPHAQFQLWQQSMATMHLNASCSFVTPCLIGCCSSAVKYNQYMVCTGTTCKGKGRLGIFRRPETNVHWLAPCLPLQTFFRKRGCAVIWGLCDYSEECGTFTPFSSIVVI